MTILKPICFFCKHYDIERSVCPAFPSGVIDDILDGDQDHDKVIKGQTGTTVFEVADAMKDEFKKRLTL